MFIISGLPLEPFAALFAEPRCQVLYTPMSYDERATSLLYGSEQT